MQLMKNERSNDEWLAMEYMDENDLVIVFENGERSYPPVLVAAFAAGRASMRAEVEGLRLVHARCQYFLETERARSAKLVKALRLIVRNYNLNLDASDELPTLEIMQYAKWAEQALAEYETTREENK